MAKSSAPQSNQTLATLSQRFGCSAVSVVFAITLLAFAFFFFRVAPGIVSSVQQFSLPAALGLELPSPTATAGDGLALASTPLPDAALTPTLAPVSAASPTADSPLTIAPSVTPTLGPSGEYVAVGNTDGTGVYLRAEPRSDAIRLKGLPDGAVLAIIGPNVTVAGQEWRNVRTTSGESLTGYILTIYLLPAAAP